MTLQTVKPATSKQLHSPRSPSPLPEDDACPVRARGDQAEASGHHPYLDGDADDQIFFQDQNGDTATMQACWHEVPLELFQLMITKAKFDPREGRLLAHTTSYGYTSLRCAAYSRSDPAVLELLIREHPLVLSATDSSGRTPLQFAPINRPPRSPPSSPTPPTPSPPAFTPPRAPSSLPWNRLAHARLCKDVRSVILEFV